jgi:hypothetical protein
MVAASATVILNDIFLSNASTDPLPPGLSDFRPGRANSPGSHQFLTARVNRSFSTAVAGLDGRGPEKKGSKQSK